MDNKKKEKLPQEVLRRRDAYEWLQCFVWALVLCVMFFTFGARLIEVKGSSMVPTLHNGERMVVSGLLYKVKAGDVVVFKKDSYDPNKALVKRVIATEGQIINIDFEKGLIYISELDENGKETEPIILEEPYINERTRNKLDFLGPKTVPEGCVFVMGDNRNQSNDSRDKDIGMVDARLIIGKVYAVVYPLNDFKFID